MKLPPDIQFHEDIRLLVYRPRGLLNEAAVNKIIKVIGELEATLDQPFDDSTIIHYARLHALLTQGSPINVRLFQDREEAAQWLGVPIARLMPDTAETT